jgi:dGTPase
MVGGMEHLLDTKRLSELEELTLAPYAVHTRDCLGREHDEPEDPSRTPFQRDWHRITHCRAFRKLEYKTQVFVHGEGGEHGDVVRNRLTHTLECTQIATSIARSLGLNEDLANSVALAHDLGHTPFGHSGELELKELVPAFNHNVHSLRIVRLLELRYPTFPGLNLTRDALEGIEKHETEYDQVGSFEFNPGLMPPLEAQVASVADTIAFKAHDVEDSLVSGVLRVDDFDAAGLRLWTEAFEPLREIASHQVQMAQLSRRLIHLMITDVRAETVQRLKDAGVQSLTQVREFKGNLVGFSGEFAQGMEALGDFLFANFYKNWRIERMTNKGRMILRRLYRAYRENPGILPPDAAKQYQSAGSEEEAAGVLADYLAGMTDRFATEEYLRLFEVGHHV